MLYAVYYFMKKIILASASIQRKNLLKNFGLKFTVYPSKADEETKIRTTCSALVKHNALLKAHDIAMKVTEGVVIGSDTVVYVGNKRILGKPRTLKEASRMLKTLFSSPRWVYTGVAVIDVETDKTIVDYVKTKIFMTRLTDKEIESYHKKVSPFDKAGGFDIEGWGSAFIYRIEGCHSNVIGLPIAKLTAMLKKVGISILSVAMTLSLFGCSTEYNLATKKQEYLLYGTEKEINIGDRVAEKIEAHYTINTNVEENQRVEEILDKIVAVCDRKDILYFIKIIDEDIMNAVSLPGGYIYVFTGLLERVDNDDQLAGVIAHEVGHITARHGVKRAQNQYAALLLTVAGVEAGIGGGVNLALTSLFHEHAQQDEFESDRLGVKYMKAAGYDPNEMAGFLKKLQEEQEKRGSRQFSYWKTHPNLARRISVINAEAAGQMDFRDYLNITENKY